MRLSACMLLLILAGCDSDRKSQQSGGGVVKLDGLHRQIYQHEIKRGEAALVTRELYSRIETGLSQEEVIKRIGAPSGNPVKFHQARADEVHFVELNEEGRKIILKYLGNIVTNKDQLGIE